MACSASGREKFACPATADPASPAAKGGTGEFFGDDGFLTGGARDSDARAVDDVSVDFLRRNEFLAILTLQPQLIAPLFEPVFDLVGNVAAPSEEDAAKDVSDDGADGAAFNIRIIRDFGSYHGTTVNGMTLGGEGRPRTAPLMTRESELIAGKPESPFRFRIVVD
jgi:hypothetical protein